MVGRCERKVWLSDLFERHTTDWSSSEKDDWLEYKALKMWEMAETTEKKNNFAIKKYLINTCESRFQPEVTILFSETKSKWRRRQIRKYIVVNAEIMARKRKGFVRNRWGKCFCKRLNPEIRKLVIGEEKIRFWKLWRKQSRFAKKRRRWKLNIRLSCKRKR